ncbi:hypothetical protein Verru16b_00611 [Lacunisphaera limnophila]|uniref:Uncharacterized protein n=1 Tax=Lacunisphaera limnophila TaxID=1838286 RepID=A0A1D8ARN9_9BACT|nr:hypothetical protein [Lacunisphaera limnophila]AOS43564.1 hypothetical protein Verru16b_00611 [Lacunisphaera limnophila]
MSPPASSSARAWLAVPLLAFGFLLWTQSAHRARVVHVTQAVPSEAVVQAASPTGYAGGIRNLVLPEQNQDSAHWIAQTQQMLATGEGRIRRIDYENAPFGREVAAASPYRWWLGLVARFDRSFSDRPAGQAVEYAALLADPWWHLLLLVAATGFTGWRFGLRAATLVSLGLAFLFPLAAGFPPGLPGDQGLALTCSLAGGLILLAGLRPTPGAARWFFAAGVAGGCGLWVSVSETVPVILGLAGGAVLAAWFTRRDPGAAPLPGHWLAWSLGGATSSLLFYLIEYAPDHLGSWQLRSNHPLYSLAWIGLGIAVFLVTGWLRGEIIPGRARLAGAIGVAVAALASLPWQMLRASDPGFLAVEAWTFRLTRLPGSPEAGSIWAWLSRDGFSAASAATLLPMLLVLPALWLLRRPDTNTAARAILAVTLGPVLVGLGFAAAHLGRWSNVDVLLLTLLVAVTVVVGNATRSPLTPGRWLAVVVLLLAPGAIPLWPPTKAPADVPLNEVEVSGLIARDLAHWLAKHVPSGQAVVLAPPNETVALHYYGGLRGIATLSWENQAGITAAVRLFSASSPQEALALVQNRGVTHLVLPSWDRTLDEFVRLGGGPADQAFLGSLRRWAQPGWLRPVAYRLPAVPGYEDQSVTIFAVVEEQEEVVALSRLAEYFVEMGRLDLAAQVSMTLQKIPADLGAGIACAHVAMARRDGAAVNAALARILPQLTAGADRWLPWDQRVSLAVVLATGGHADLARGQVQRCLTDADETRLRSASTGALYRLVVLARRFGLSFPDPRLRATALELLPPETRAQL